MRPSGEVKRPEEVLVGPYTYRVEWTDGNPEEGNVGVALTGELCIRVNKHQPPQRVRETLLHEVLHCIFELAGMTDNIESSDEELVTSLSPLLLDVLQRSKGLADYLMVRR